MVGRAQALLETMPSARFFKRDKDGQFSSGDSGGRVAAPDLIAAGRAEEIATAAFAAAAGLPRPEGADELAGRRLYRGGGVGPHGDEALHHIAALQGFEGPAVAVSSKEMSKGVKQGDAELFRGVHGSADGTKTAADIHEQFRSGEAFHGLGYSGNGIYMSSSRQEAGTYGTVGRYALHRDARVVDYRALQTEHAAFIRSVGADSVTGRVFADPGRYAAARGYDAIKWRRGEEAGKKSGEEDELIILNRTAMLAEVS